jgi:transketolase
MTAILDMNRLGQRGETEFGWHGEVYAARARSFGWHAIEIDGHDLKAIDKAYTEALAQSDKPTVIVARTEKGSGFSQVANKDGWHGKAFSADQAKAAIAELGGERNVRVTVQKPEDRKPPALPAPKPPKLPVYEVGAKEATRKAYGDALVALGAARGDVVVLDGEVSNSTHADEFKKAYPDRFFEMFIAEQQMVSTAVGLAVREKITFSSTFAAFYTRAFDQIRMAAISNATIRLCGSHAGVSIGEDGPSQMALEDLAMMRAVGGSTVLYPSDPNQTAQLVAAMADVKGISYLRSTREKTAVLYPASEKFTIGGSKVLKQSDGDKVTIIAAGITVHEALKAYETLKAAGISARVIDAYSVKPIDKQTLRAAAQKTGRFVVAEDHWPEGGLGDAVLEAFSLLREPSPKTIKLGVKGMPGSGKPAELMKAAGIDATAIVDAAKSLL